MHAAPVLIISVLLSGIISCSIEMVHTEDQKAMACKIPTAYTLSHPVCTEPMAIDHGNQLPLLENFAQFSILAGVHSYIVEIFEEPRVDMVLRAPT